MRDTHRRCLTLMPPVQLSCHHSVDSNAEPVRLGRLSRLGMFTSLSNCYCLQNLHAPHGHLRSRLHHRTSHDPIIYFRSIVPSGLQIPSWAALFVLVVLHFSRVPTLCRHRMQLYIASCITHCRECRRIPSGPEGLPQACLCMPEAVQASACFSAPRLYVLLSSSTGPVNRPCSIWPTTSAPPTSNVKW